MKLVRAAPASFFSLAVASQAALAAKAEVEKAATARVRMLNRVFMVAPSVCCRRRRASPRAHWTTTRAARPPRTAHYRMRRGCASASCAACSRRTSTRMNAASNRRRVPRPSCSSVCGVKEMVVAGSDDHHVGAVDAQRRARRQVGHLAHRGAGAELRHALAVAVHLDLALRDDVEAVALLALAVQRMAEGAALPAARGAPPPTARHRRSRRRTPASAAG